MLQGWSLPEAPGQDLFSAPRGCPHSSACDPFLNLRARSGHSQILLTSHRSDSSVSLSAPMDPGDYGGPTCITPGTLPSQGQQMEQPYLCSAGKWTYSQVVETGLWTPLGAVLLATAVLKDK